MRALSIACLLVAAAAHAEEHALAEFGGSYVVTLPAGYTAERAWPLVLDFHGAIAPSRKGARVTRDRLWRSFAKEHPNHIVVGLNGRTRAWGTTKGERDDRAYALAALKAVRAKWNVDPKRIYLAGFSSGSDWLCKSNLQLAGPFAGSLVVCPGPPNVVGLRGGELLKAKAHPFYFAAGEEDYIRKSGAWEAFVALDEAGGRAWYREVPGKGHEFFEPEEYARLLAHLAGRPPDLRAALARGDYLLASTDETLRPELAKIGARLAAAAARINSDLEPGRAYEAWWKVRTQFHRFPKLAARAQERLDAIHERHGNAELFRARRLYFRTRGQPPRKDGLWAFDRYLGVAAVEAHLRDLAQRFPDRVQLEKIGASVQGRPIWALRIGDKTRPAAYVQGGLHGNEASSVMVALYMAWQFAANPAQRRSIDRLRRDVSLYVVPCANPDAYHHYLNGAFSHWRPRYNFRPFDADGDGRIDEDGAEDLDGDGEIGQMYRRDPKGRYVLKDGKLVVGKGGDTYTLLGIEGIDNDGDGKLNEDPAGGVDLNRNFAHGFTARTRFKGSSGAAPFSEPETRAIRDFVLAHPNIALFLDVHNAARCLFFWVGADAPKSDFALYAGAAKRAQKALGYAPRPLRHEGAGLSIAWAYGTLGRFAFLLELEAGNDGVFVAPKPFKHPQLGDVLIGNDFTKLSKRNPPPRGLAWLAERNWAWVRGELANLPQLELVDPKIAWDGERFTVTSGVRNSGALPTDTAHAVRTGKAAPVQLAAEGATLDGEADLGVLGPGETRAFTVRLREPHATTALVVSHPRAGRARLLVRGGAGARVPIRRAYTIEEGSATPDTARRANNEFYADGESAEERGPAFALAHRKDVLRMGVLLGEWADYEHRIDVKAFERALFSEGTYRGWSPTGQAVYGSLRDFYLEMSYGRLKVEGEVFPWVELPGTRAAFEKASFGSPIVQESLKAAIRKRHGADVLDRFDGLMFVWAGNAVRRTSALWPMRLGREKSAAFKMGEFHQGEFAAIGVACHEMGHTFGVADKYGLGATRNPLGPYCLMGKGTHGAPPSGRHRPFHMCAWCKAVIGWVQPAVIDPTRPQKLALRPILFGPGECYRILLKPDGSEYLLLENRRREGFMADLPSPGLLVLKVGPNDAPAYPQTRVQLLPAHGLPPARRGVIAAPERVAWPQPGKSELVVDGVRLHGIRRVDDVVYFEVGRVK